MRFSCRNNSELVAETALYQIYQRVYCDLLIRTIRNDLDVSAAYDTQRQDTQQALCIYPTLFLFDPDRGLELVGTLNEKCSRSCVQTNLILYCNFFYKHDKNSPILMILRFHASYVGLKKLCGFHSPGNNLCIPLPFYATIIPFFPEHVNAFFAEIVRFSGIFYVLL